MSSCQKFNFINIPNYQKEFLKMSEFDQEVEQLDEFKASMGDPSMVPEPTATKAKAPGPSKSNSEKPIKQGTSDVADDPDVEEVPQEAPKTKMAMINAMVQQMNQMDKSEMSKKYGKMLQAMKMEEVEVDEDEDQITISSKQPVKLTTADIDISEDVASMFAGQDLSEEFVEKATTIFEAAVLQKVNEQLEKITIDVEEEIAEAKESIQESLSDKLDSYLDYVVENWMEENQLAIEKGLRAEITTDFMEGLKGLFSEHYIDIPDDRVDVAEELAIKTDELVDALNEEINNNLELRKEIEEYKREEVLFDVSEDLSETQRDKLRSLVEGVEFDSAEQYANKVLTIKEHYFPADVVEESVADDDEPLELDEQVQNYADPNIAAYVNAISRTKK